MYMSLFDSYFIAILSEKKFDAPENVENEGNVNTDKGDCLFTTLYVVSLISPFYLAGGREMFPFDFVVDAIYSINQQIFGRLYKIVHSKNEEE